MPSVNTGSRKIKNIKMYKDHVTLSFFKGEPLKISKEAFVSSYLYAGKNLSSKDIANLEEITAMTNLLNYALQIVSKKHLSEKEMLEILLKKEDNYVAAKKVITKLKENDLLDDKAFMQDLIAWDNERNFGQNKIIKHLKDKGIPEALINKVNFPQSLEKKKAKALLDKLDRKYSLYAYESKKKHVYQALVSQGYNHDIARDVTNDLKRGNDKVERSLLNKDYEKIKNRYEKKYEGYQLKQKIYAALINKGYKYQEIKKVLEDFTYEDDCGF